MILRTSPVYRFALLGVLICLQQSCVAGTSIARLRVPIAFPPPPTPARVILVSSASNVGELGVRPTWFRRLWNRFAGQGDGEPLDQPFAVALTTSRLAISDTGLNQILWIERDSATGYVVDRIDGEAIFAPVGLAWASEDRLWVSDAERGLVARIDRHGRSDLRLVLPGRPAGIAVSPNGMLAVAIPPLNMVALYRLNEAEPAVILGQAPYQTITLSFPTHVAFDAKNNLYICDAMNFRILVLDSSADWALLRSVGTRGDSPGYFARPKGIAVTADSTLLVVDGLQDSLQFFDDQGQLLLQLGQSGQDLGQFWSPTGVAVSGHEIIVADMYNSRVQWLQLTSHQDKP